MASQQHHHPYPSISGIRYREFIAGWGTGIIETCMLFPVGKLIFRQQQHNLTMPKAIRQAFKMHGEGLLLLYRGVLPPLISRSVARSIMFGTFENYQRLLGCSPSVGGLSSCHAAAAILAGETEALLAPLERVQVLLQFPAHNKRFKNTFDAFRSIFNDHGIREFFRGFSIIMLRNGSCYVTFFTLREPLRAYILSISQRNNKNGPEIATSITIEDPFQISAISATITDEHFGRVQTGLANFVSGAMLGACISTFFYPIDVVKNRMQTIVGGPFNSPLKIFKIVWRERNGSLKEYFRGAQLNFVVSLLSWGLTNMIYEFLLEHIHKRSK